jgi:methyl-accepting chemotaxis protein
MASYKLLVRLFHEQCVLEKTDDDGTQVVVKPNKASELILTETERMKGLTGQGKASTREQSRASGDIAHSTEAMAGMIRQIKRACDEQSKGSEQIVHAAENIHGATAVNQDATRVLGSAVADLQQQTGNLQQEMATFRTMQEAPADS